MFPVFVRMFPIFVWMFPVVVWMFPVFVLMFPVFVWMFPIFVWMFPAVVWMFTDYLWLLPVFVLLFPECTNAKHLSIHHHESRDRMSDAWDYVKNENTLDTSQKWDMRWIFCAEYFALNILCWKICDEYFALNSAPNIFGVCKKHHLGCSSWRPSSFYLCQ